MPNTTVRPAPIFRDAYGTALDSLDQASQGSPTYSTLYGGMSPETWNAIGGMSGYTAQNSQNAAGYTNALMGQDPMGGASQGLYGDYMAGGAAPQDYFNQMMGQQPGSNYGMQALQGFGGQTGQNAATDFYQQMMAGGLGGDQYNMLANTVQGQYLSPESNPWLTGAFDQGADQLQARLGSQFAAGGRNGGALLGSTAQGLSSLGNQIYGGNYQQERSRQMQAQQMMEAIRTGNLGMQMQAAGGYQGAMDANAQRQLQAALGYTSAYGDEQNRGLEAARSLQSGQLQAGGQSDAAFNQMTNAQLQAAGMAPAFDAANQSALATNLQAGQLMDADTQAMLNEANRMSNFDYLADWDQFGRYAGGLTTLASPYSQTHTTGGGAGGVGGALGGALGGYQLGSIFGPVGGGVGAVAGGLLGGLF